MDDQCGKKRMTGNHRRSLTGRARFEVASGNERGEEATCDNGTESRILVREDTVGWVDEDNAWVIGVSAKVRKEISSMGGWTWIERMRLIKSHIPRNEHPMTNMILISDIQ